MCRGGVAPTVADDNDFPWHLGVFDAHCHPTDTLASLRAIPDMHAKVLTIMATRAEDQDLVANAAAESGVTTADLHDAQWTGARKILPAFGWHPWFSHQMYDEADCGGALSLGLEDKVAHYRKVLVPSPADHSFLEALPDPLPFGRFMAQTRDRLLRFPVALIGEVGLDRSFRIPEPWTSEQLQQRDAGITPGSREGRRLSPYRVSMEHQKKVLLAQLALAGELQRPASVHGVSAHGVLYETLAQSWTGHEKKALSNRDKKKIKAAARIHAEPEADDSAEQSFAGPKTFPPRICLHSYSGPAETVKQYLPTPVPCEVFFSFSTTINNWSDDGQGKVEAAVRAVPDELILVESDLDNAGPQMDACLRDAVHKICQVKGWSLEAGVKQLGQNWLRFVSGHA